MTEPDRPGPSDPTASDDGAPDAATSGPDRIPMTPPSAAAVFADRVGVVEHYVALLATTGIDHGLVGPREAPRLWDRHVLGCGVVAALLGPTSTLADIGSGAGLPGLVLAIARPDVTVTLVEPLHRRIVWLERAVAELGLDNVRLHEGRAESLWSEATYDVVTARAVARIGVLAQWCLPLVAPQGRLVAIKGRTVEDELSEDADALRQAGATGWRVEHLGGRVLDPPATVAVVEVGDETPRPQGRPGEDGSPSRRATAAGKGRRPSGQGRRSGHRRR